MTDGDDLLERRQRSDWRMRPRFDPQPERRARGLDTDLGALIDRRIEAVLTKRLGREREYLLDLLAEALAAVNKLAMSVERAREDDRRQRADELRQLRTEQCEQEAKTQTAIADLYRIIAALGGAPIDLPALPS